MLEAWIDTQSAMPRHHLDLDFALMIGSDTAEHLLRRAQLGVDRLLFATRKRRRLAICGIESPAHLTCAAVDLRSPTTECISGCDGLVDERRRELARFLFRGEPGLLRVSDLWHGVPCVIDLGDYPDFSSYLKKLRRHSNKGIIKQIKKARAHGFYSKRIFRGLYQRQCFEIETSKRYRSGPVYAAFFRRTPTDFEDGITVADVARYLKLTASEVGRGVIFPEPPPSPCCYHWSICWGVFIKEGVTGESGIRYPERLVGYVFLKRVGNIIRPRIIMGHGDFLSRHVMKLLFHDIMEWLLARQDPRVNGIRYFLYGAIEHGNDGLLAWKRSFEFAPVVFGWHQEPSGQAISRSS